MKIDFYLLRLEKMVFSFAMNGILSWWNYHMEVIVRIVTMVFCCAVLFSCASRQAVRNDSALEVKPTFSFSGNEGTSFHDAVVVTGAKTQKEGMEAEQHFISNLHGRRGLDWFLVGQTIIHEQNKIVDVVEIQISNSTDRKIFYFDATSFLLEN